MTDTKIAPLRRPDDALTARVALIDEAEARVDLQYYQWDSDAVGYLLMDRLLAAADRGVDVRLLVDDLKLRRRTRRAASLCLHPHFAVRFFNPWTMRRNPVAAAAEFVTRFTKLDRRMHNKLLVVDGRRAIAGGRNIADAHYGRNTDYNLVDYDLYLTGVGASRLQAVFETYWQSAPAVPAIALDPSVSRSDLAASRALVENEANARSSVLPPSLGDDAWRRRLDSDSLAIPEDALQVVADRPGVGEDTRHTQVIHALHRAVDEARRELVVVTPFFVPNEMDIAWYRTIVDRGVRIRLLTNSLASNSGTISNSGLNRRRKALVEAGVELFELRSDAADKPEWETAPTVGTYLGLHAKLYTIDRARLFLGSVNLDPRSKFINTETGIMIDNADLARNTAEGIERLMTPANAWRVEIGPGERVTWANDAVSTHRQPARSFTQRVADRIFEILPIDPYI